MGPSQIAKAENAVYDGTSLVAVNMYNNLYERVKASYEYFIPYMSLNGQTVYADKALYDKFMSYGHMGVNLGEREDGSMFRLEPDENNNVSARIKVNNFKPYLGFGYGGRLFKEMMTIGYLSMPVFSSGVVLLRLLPIIYIR